MGTYYQPQPIPATGYNFNPGAQPTPIPYQQPAPTQYGSIVKVTGKEGAMMYGNGLGPNRSALVVDNTADDIIYCIVTDGAGLPTVKKFRFHEEAEEHAASGTEYATKEDLTGLRSQVTTMQEKFNKLMEELNGKPDS